jgi:hypothetical protein
MVLYQLCKLYVYVRTTCVRTTCMSGQPVWTMFGLLQRMIIATRLQSKAGFNLLVQMFYEIQVFKMLNHVHHWTQPHSHTHPPLHTHIHIMLPSAPHSHTPLHTHIHIMLPSAPHSHTPLHTHIMLPSAPHLHTISSFQISNSKCYIHTSLPQMSQPLIT